jgi:hypothetical protein
MIAPITDFEAPVPSDELRVTGPIWVIVPPAPKVSPRLLEDTTFTIAFALASVPSTVKMYG